MISMYGIQRNTNDLINGLISKVEDHSKNLTKRVKSNCIFSEFDMKTKDQLNEFIKLSSLRYKGVKSGNDLQNILGHHKLIYNHLIDKISKDNFYQTKEIDVERKKLFKRTDKKKIEEIRLLQNQIKQETKSISKFEVRLRQRLLRRREKSKLNQSLYQHTKSRLAFNYQPKFTFDNKRQINDPVMTQEDDSEENETSKMNSNEEKKRYFEELIYADEKKMRSGLNDYNEYLSRVQSSLDDGDEMKLEHKFNFLTENYKMLTYKEEDNANIVKKKKEDPVIDIIKLMRYTKRGKKTKWVNRIKTNEQHQTNPVVDADADANAEAKEKQCPMSKTGNDFRSTTMIIKSEAEKVAKIDNEFNKKRAAVGNYYHHYNLPNANECEAVIRIKSGLHHLNRGKAKETEGPLELATKIDSKQYCRNKSSSSRHTTVDRSIQWRQRHEDSERRKVKEREQKREIEKFVKEAKSIHNQPQYYIDCDSKKNNSKPNKQIVQEAFTLAKGPKKKIVKYDKYINTIKINKRQAQRMNEELVKGEIIAKRIKENIKNENLPEDVDITYKVFAQKIDGISNKQEYNPYKEFIEFKGRITDREFWLNNKTAPLSTNADNHLKTSTSISTKTNINVEPCISHVKKGYSAQINSEYNRNHDMKCISVEKANEVE